jgi:AraC-like DNA-binding protein
MPALRHDLIHGDNIGLFYGHLDPVDIAMHSHRAHAQIMLLFKPAVCELTWRIDGEKPRQEHLRGAQLCIVAPKVEHALRWKEKAGIAKFYVTARFLRRFGCAESALRGVQVQDLAFVSGRDALARHLTSVFETLCVDDTARQDHDFAVAAGRVLTGRLLKFHLQSPRRGSRDGRLSGTQQKTLNDFLDANLHRGIGVEELMDLVFLSKAHFIRLFTRTYGVPPVRSHLLRRLQRAEETLLHTDCTILDAVHRFGFADQSYFNRSFLKYLKYRPGTLLHLRAKLPPR